MGREPRGPFRPGGLGSATGKAYDPTNSSAPMRRHGTDPLTMTPAIPYPALAGALEARGYSELTPVQAAIMDGRQPVGLTLQSLRDREIPMCWSDQRWLVKLLAF